MKRKLIYYGNPILRKRGMEIEQITDGIREMTVEMFELMQLHNGAGLAAPQVGESIRLFLACPYITRENGRLELTPPRTYINPKITILSEQYEVMDEACLSLPGVRGDVIRPSKIRIEAINLEGQQVVEEHEGLNARLLLHENDHINGVLYIDRMHPKERRTIEQRLQEIKKRYKS